jgi:hypothetical protein
MNALASFTERWLPVFIPVFLTVAIILAGILNKRIKLTPSSLLEIHSDIVIGLFSFVIWALVAFQQNGRVDLNADYSISFVRVILLLFANFLLLIAGLVVLSIKWEQIETSFVKRSPGKWKNLTNGAFLLLTALAIFTPILLATKQDEDAASTRLYTVAVPYLDGTIPRQVGATRWDNRVLCEIADVRAAKPSAARDSALLHARASSRLQPLFPRSSADSMVRVLSDQILVRVQ